MRFYFKVQVKGQSNIKVNASAVKMAASPPTSGMHSAASKMDDEGGGERREGKEGSPAVPSRAASIGSMVGSGTSWELIPDPPSIPEEHRHLIPPTTTPVAVSYSTTPPHPHPHPPLFLMVIMLFTINFITVGTCT